jgi:hypothetical protein
MSIVNYKKVSHKKPVIWILSVPFYIHSMNISTLIFFIKIYIYGFKIQSLTTACWCLRNSLFFMLYDSFRKIFIIDFSLVLIF